MYKLLAKDG